VSGASRESRQTPGWVVVVVVALIVGAVGAVIVLGAGR